MRPVALVIFACIAVYAFVLFLVSSHGALPASATEVRIDTLLRPTITPATRALDSLDSLIERWH
jgi:hypothetical protein